MLCSIVTCTIFYRNVQKTVSFNYYYFLLKIKTDYGQSIKIVKAIKITKQQIMIATELPGHLELSFTPLQNIRIFNYICTH